MTEQTKTKFKYWLLGIITGGGIATPITAFFVKRHCDKKTEELVAKAEDNAMNTMAEYAISQQQEEKELNEEDYAEKPNEPTMDVPEDDDINDYDLNIDDKEATEEARSRTEEHERYLDMINKYNGDDVIPPRVISEDEFVEEQYMHKSYVNWYSYDNVFEEELTVIEDPYANFGVTNGAELFRNSDNRRDPNIVYIRNEKLSTDFEITRVYGSYAVMVGGEESLGETDTQ